MGETTRYFIAGPCAIESVDSFVSFADELVRAFAAYPEFRLVYKGSFDKANRSLAGSPRGTGLDNAVDAWLTLKERYPDLLLTTDVHEPWQCDYVVERGVDILQIPAMLGRQTSLLEAAAATGKIVNLKMPIWEDVFYFDQARTKTRPAKETWLTYRGTGVKNDLAVRLEALVGLLDTYGPEHQVFDLTHTNLGRTRISAEYAKAANAIGYQHFFAEVHPDPEAAICDSRHQLSVSQLTYLLGQVC